MAENAPTYDELMSKYNELVNKNKEMQTKMDSYDEKIGKLTDDLETSRALNTKLMFQDTSVKESTNTMEPVSEPEPETLEMFIDSFNKEAVKIVNRKYGEKIYADDN